MGTFEGQFVGWLEAEPVAVPEQDTHARVTALVEEYSTTLYRVAYSVTRNTADAEDVVVERGPVLRTRPRSLPLLKWQS